MKSEAVVKLVQQHFRKSALPEPGIAVDDAARIREHFKCALPEGFAEMRALIGIYRIDGDHLPVDEIIATFESESAINPQWEPDFLPFCAVGNGDYLCFRRSECPDSAIYFVPHDEPRLTMLHASFDEYLRDREWFY